MSALARAGGLAPTPGARLAASAPGSACARVARRRRVRLQALLCLGSCVRGMRGAGIHQYTDFAAVSSCHVWRPGGSAIRVPSSTADVHALSSVPAAGKRALWLLMQQAERAATVAASTVGDAEPFVSVLDRFGIPDDVQVRAGAYLESARLRRPGERDVVGADFFGGLVVRRAR